VAVITEVAAIEDLQFLMPRAPPPQAALNEEEEEALGLVERGLLSNKRQRVESAYATHYEHLACVVPTSNDAERLFSKTKMTFRDHRKCMHPETLDKLMFLRFNMHLWDVVTVEKVLDAAPEEEDAEPTDFM
jgi:hypothetical protein